MTTAPPLTLKPLGLVSDPDPEELPPGALSQVVNAIPDETGVMRQAHPFAPVFGSLLYQPRYLIPNQDDVNAYWLYAADANVGVTDGVSHFNITPAGMTSGAALASPYTGGVINQLPVLNNRQDEPWYWDQATANVMQTLPGWPASDLCESLRPFREFLIAMNIFTGGARIPDLLRWSDAAAPGAVPQSWTAGPSSQAGEVSVSFNPGQLVDGRQLRDRFVIYKTTSTYVLQLVGGTFVFTNRPVFSTVGALSRNCIVEWRGRHIVLTDGDLVQHDLTTVQSLVRSRNRKEIFDNLDGTNFENSYLVLRKDLNELWVCRPRVGETYPTEALVLNLDSGEFGRRELVNTNGTPHATEGLVNVVSSTLEKTWDAKTTTWETDPTRWNSAAFQRTANFVVMADFTASELQQVGEGNDFDGSPINVTLERQGLDLGEPEQKKYVKSLRPSLIGTPGLTVQIELGYHDSPDDDPQYTAPRTFVVGTDRELFFDDDAVEAYYVAYRITSAGQLEWSLPSMRVTFELAGEY